MTVHIRRATRDDIAAIAKLAARLAQMHHAIDPYRFLLVAGIEKGYADFFREEIGDEGAVILAAESDEGESPTIVGYAYGRLEPRNWNDLLEACGKLHDLYVDESVRKSRVAKKLVLEMIERLESLGAPRVVLLTAHTNEAAQKLFKGIGFRPTMLEMTRETRRERRVPGEARKGARD